MTMTENALRQFSTTARNMAAGVEAAARHLAEPHVAESIHRASRRHISSEDTVTAALDAVQHHLKTVARHYRDLMQADTAQAILTPDDTLPADLPRSEPCNDPACCPEADQ